MGIGFSCLLSDQYASSRHFAILAGVAASSYLLGWRSVLVQCQKSLKNGSSSLACSSQPCINGSKDLQDSPATSSIGELLHHVSKLQPKPLGPSSLDEENRCHSAARLVLMCCSGKGGVGKSTVCVNLAFMFRRLGLEVGILDLDVYGPSLPLLVKLPDVDVMHNEHNRIVPMEYDGVALMSWGYVHKQAATVRAPILNQYVSELLTQVEWGLLDILLIDSPPGTGDILLSIGQTLPVDGAVVVTTSNDMSFADVVKGVQLLEKMEIPPALVVANMSAFCCDQCGHCQALFADGAMDKLPEFLKSRGVGLMKLPLDPLLSQTPRQASPPQTLQYPYVRNPDYDERAAMKGYGHLANAVLDALLRNCTTKSQDGMGNQSRKTTLQREPSGGLVLSLGNGEIKPLACGALRAACQCAHCVDEITGEVKIDREKIMASNKLQAMSVDTVGNYATRIVWSDGHSSLMSMRAIEQMATKSHSSQGA